MVHITYVKAINYTPDFIGICFNLVAFSCPSSLNLWLFLSLVLTLKLKKNVLNVYFREEGRGETSMLRIMGWWPPVCPPSGDRGHNWCMCPEQEWDFNLPVLRSMINQEPYQLG